MATGREAGYPTSLGAPDSFWTYNEKEGEEVLKRRLISAAAVAIVALFLISAVPGARAYTPQPTTSPIEPNPMIAGNVTFQTHQSGWGPLEYTNQFGAEQNISASTNPYDVNPYAVNPADIAAPGILQDNTINGIAVNNTSSTGYWQLRQSGGGTVTQAPSTFKQNGVTYIKTTANTTAAAATAADGLQFIVPVSDYPSTNTLYDYMTVVAVMTGPASSGTGLEALIANRSSGTSGWTTTGTAGYSAANGSLQIAGTKAPILNASLGQPLFLSFSLADAQTQLGIGFSTTAGSKYSDMAEIDLIMVMPKEANTTYTLTVYGAAMTLGPLNLGTTKWNGTAVTRQAADAPLNLTSFSPTFSYTEVTDQGYTADIAQEAANLTPQNVSISQTSIAGTSYVEQVTYSFLYGLPSAPSLAYATFKALDKVTLSAAQYVSVTFAGTSYLTKYTAAHAEGNTTTISSSIVATQNESWVGTVQYTQAQWNSISAPPGFFTVEGIAYYWYLLIGAIAAGVVGGSAWAAKGRSAARELRGRK